MNVKPLNCANCGSPVQVTPETSVATCSHCQTTMTIEWPGAERRRYVSPGYGSPFVRCPVCSTQLIRSDNLADQQVPCPECGSPSQMPPRADYEMKVCPTCGRVYSSQEGHCPDADTHDSRSRYPGPLF
jgi:DNA-directed RNA polymerase subunit RPC12/RpoP